MVLLPMDVSGTIRMAWLLTLLMMGVSGYVTEDQVARQDMLCDTYRVREPVHGRHTEEAHSDYENCVNELNGMVSMYVRAKATDAQVTQLEWLQANAHRYDEFFKTYTLIVRGGLNKSKRFVTYKFDHYEDPIRPPPPGKDDLHERFMALKNRQQLS